MDSRHFLAKPAVYKCGIAFARHVPSFLLYAITDRIAELSYLLYGKEKKAVRTNIKRVFPEAAKQDVNRTTFRIFKNYGRYLSDYGKFLGGDTAFINKKFLAFEGEENLNNALSMKKGVILVTAHLGNWELGATFFGRNNIKTSVITLKDRDEGIDLIRTWYRNMHNVNTISLGYSPFSYLDLVSAVNRNEIVAMLIDRYEAGKGGIEADFFGCKTYFPLVPFWLSKAAQSPIIPAFVVREGKGYKGIVEKPIIVSTENDIPQAVNKVAGIFEKHIRKYPEQWYNFTVV